MLTLTISIFQNLPADVLTRASATRGWSIAQCLWHLNRYGDYYLPRVTKVIEGAGPSSEKFRSGWLGSYFTTAMKNETKKMKAFKSHTPPADPNDTRAVAQFIQQLERLTVLLKKAHQANLNARMPISLTRLIRLKLGCVAVLCGAPAAARQSGNAECTGLTQPWRPAKTRPATMACTIP